MRTELREWLRRLHDEVPVTTVFVTHDQEEALEVADEIVVINDGRVEQARSEFLELGLRTDLAVGVHEASVDRLPVNAL